MMHIFTSHILLSRLSNTDSTINIHIYNAPNCKEPIVFALSRPEI